MKAALVGAVLAAAACTETVQVLQPPPDAAVRDAAIGVDNCEEAFIVDVGTTCLTGLWCEVPVPDVPCCTVTAQCDAGAVLERTESCDCASCEDDSGCAFGVQTCDAGMCVDCPIEAACDACPDGLLWLDRNGCTTCVCAPPTECSPTGECDVGACVRGDRCSDGCPAEDYGCCSSVCDFNAGECPTPVPQGCEIACDAAHQDCGGCVTIDCNCVGGEWSCGQICVGDLAPTCSV